MELDPSTDFESSDGTKSTLPLLRAIPAHATAQPEQSSLRRVEPTSSERDLDLGNPVPIPKTRLQREALLLHHSGGKALTLSQTKPRYNICHQARMVTT